MRPARSSSALGSPVPMLASNGELGLALSRRRGSAVRPWLLGLTLVAVTAVAGAFLIHRGETSLPYLTVIAPTDGAILAPGPTTISVQLVNGQLGAGKDGHGLHLHYYLDVEPPTAPDRKAITRLGTWASSDLTFHVWNVVGAGTHVLSVQLVRSDDMPLVPPVIATVTVRIPAAATPPGTATPADPRVRPATSGGGC
jgi:hypothetical protein